MDNIEKFHESLADCMINNFFEIGKLEWLLEMVKSNSVKYFKFEPKVVSGDTPIYTLEIQFKEKEGSK